MNDQTAMVPSEQPAQTQGLAVAAAQSREIAQQQSLMMMAKRFPRDLDVFREKVLRECKNATFAELAIYDLPFGKEHVRGGSIRLAEGVFRAMQYYWLSVFQSSDTPSLLGRPGFRTWRAEFLDIQNGTVTSDEVTVEKTVERRSPPSDRAVLATRTTSEGNTVFICEATSAELLAKENSAKSKMRRNLILAAIETSTMDDIKAEIRKTNEAEASRDPAETRRKILDAFADVGVDVAELKRYTGQEIDTLSPKQLVDLRELWSGINDGFCTWADALADKGIGPAVADVDPKDAGPVGGLMDRIRQRQSASKGEPAQKAAEPPARQEGPPPRTEQASGAKPTKKELLSRLVKLLNDSPKVIHDAVRAEHLRLGKKSMPDCDEAALMACIAVAEKEISRERD